MYQPQFLRQSSIQASEQIRSRLGLRHRLRCSLNFHRIDRTLRIVIWRRLPANKRSTRLRLYTNGLDEETRHLVRIRWTAGWDLAPAVAGEARAEPRKGAGRATSLANQESVKMPLLHVQAGSADQLQNIADALWKARKVVVITGAGISTNSGIPVSLLCILLRTSVWRDTRLVHTLQLLTRTRIFDPRMACTP